MFFDILFKHKNYENILGYKCYFFLSQFIKSQNIYSYDDIRKWKDLLNEKPSKVADFLIYKKWIQPVTAEDFLKENMNVSDIKLFLKKHGEKITGKKENLIARVIENDLLDKFSPDELKDFYIVSDLGKEIALNFLKKYNQDEKDIIEKLIKLLSIHNYKEAIDFASYYIDNRYFEFSDIKGYVYFDKDEKRIILNKVKAMINCKSKIFNTLDDKIFIKIKIYAVVFYLLGYNYKNNPLIDMFGTLNFKYSLIDCFKLIDNYAYTEYLKNEYKEFYFKVSSGCSPACDSFNSVYKGNEYTYKNVPELPNPNCKSEHGCTCILSVTTSKV